MTKLVQISAKICGGVALAVLSFANIAPAQSATFNFDSGDNIATDIVKTVDGITLTVFNSEPTGIFTADSNGLLVSGSAADSFELRFDTAVQLNSYNVGLVEFLDGNETITLTAGSESSVENSPFVTGVRNFANMITVAANEIITVVSSGGNDGAEAIQWSEITVTDLTPPATTPEPVSLVALLGVGALGFASRKQK